VASATSSRCRSSRSESDQNVAPLDYVRNGIVPRLR
jgi:hypothetical protein